VGEPPSSRMHDGPHTLLSEDIIALAGVLGKSCALFVMGVGLVACGKSGWFGSDG